MYYWAKFVKQDVTIVIKNKLQHWVPGNASSTTMTKDGTMRRPHKQGENWNVLEDLRHNATPPLASVPGCHAPFTDETDFRCFVPYRDYMHFTGSSKPWQQSLHKLKTHSFYKLWFQELQQLNTELKMQLDLDNWDSSHLHTMKESPLGYMAKWTDRATIVKNHKGSDNDTNTINETTTNTTTTNA